MDTLSSELSLLIQNYVIFKPKTNSELFNVIDEWYYDNYDLNNIFHGNNYPININTWDTSLITDMSNIFFGKIYFNETISNWNVSNVTNMSNMFLLAEEFDQYIGNWNINNVINMNNMLSGTESFNQSIINWEISEYVNINSIFQPIELINDEVEFYQTESFDETIEYFDYIKNDKNYN